MTEILLVDDDPNILLALSSSLADSSHRITTALGGQKALDVLRQKHFELVITDLHMPRVDGIIVLKKAKGIRPNTKVILMTGSVLPASTRRLVSREADGFLAKPFSLEELNHAVASCFGSKGIEPNPSNKTFYAPADALSP
jgi:DNA-binding NtrC family response regulator